jgi:hypothetical protein
MRYITVNPSKQESAGKLWRFGSTTICGLLRTEEIRFGTFFKHTQHIEELK